MYLIELSQENKKLRLNESSILNWTNPERQQERGEIYVWLDEGRPKAIGTLFTYEHGGKVYHKHEFHSLAHGPLRATFDGTLAWAPQQPGITWHEFKDVRLPAATHVARMLQ